MAGHVLGGLPRRAWRMAIYHGREDHGDGNKATISGHNLHLIAGYGAEVGAGSTAYFRRPGTPFSSGPAMTPKLGVHDSI